MPVPPDGSGRIDSLRQNSDNRRRVFGQPETWEVTDVWRFRIPCALCLRYVCFNPALPRAGRCIYGSQFDRLDVSVGRQVADGGFSVGPVCCRAVFQALVSEINKAEPRLHPTVFNPEAAFITVHHPDRLPETAFQVACRLCRKLDRQCFSGSLPMQNPCRQNNPPPIRHHPPHSRTPPKPPSARQRLPEKLQPEEVHKRGNGRPKPPKPSSCPAQSADCLKRFSGSL